MVDIYVRENDQPVQRHRLDQQVISIGRLAENSLVLSSDQVSRRHALLEHDGERWLIVDRGSNNGTFVDGQRLSPEAPTPLPPNAAIRIGPFLLAVDAPPAEDVLPDPYSDDPTILGGPEPSGAATPSTILAELQSAYAAALELPEASRAETLTARLLAHRTQLGDRAFADLLHELIGRVVPEQSATHIESSPAIGEELYVAGHRVLAELSKELLGGGTSFTSAAEIEHFGQLLTTFVRSAATWIERCSTLRSDVVESFGTQLARLRGDHDPIDTIHTANEVARFALDWRDPDKSGSEVATRLGEIFRSFAEQQEAVLRGAREAAEAVMLALSPASAERRARADASWLGAAGITHAKRSALWQAFAQEWARLSEPGRLQAEFVGPKMKEAFRRMDDALDEQRDAALDRVDPRP